MQQEYLSYEGLRHYHDKLLEQLLIFEGAEIYSTEETEIGIWIDRKPLYRKCYQTTTASSIGQAKPIVPLPQNIEKVANLFGQFFCSNQEIPINYFGSPTYYVATYVNYSMNYVVMNISHNSYTNCPLVIILEYTKTTDTATLTEDAIIGPSENLTPTNTGAVTSSGGSVLTSTVAATLSDDL